MSDEPKQLGSCCRCDKPIMSLGVSMASNPDDAMEGKMRGHYGSRHDMDEFTAWLCDDCVDLLKPTMRNYFSFPTVTSRA